MAGVGDRTRTRPRVSAACVRCQKRKIRCDGSLPSCASCQKAGVACIDGGTSRELPKNYISELESRVEWLESIIRQNLPDINLDGGPAYKSRKKVVPKPVEPEVDVERNRWIRQNRSSIATSLEDISDQLGFLSVATGTDIRYIGPSSGWFFTKYALASLGKRAQIEKTENRLGDGNTLTDNYSVPIELMEVTPRGLPSDEVHARLLAKSYFETVHLQYPFLYELKVFKNIEKLYRDGDDMTKPDDRFQVLMVLAIGATILSQRAKVTLYAEGYCASAMHIMEPIFREISMSSIQGLLLLQIYTMYNKSSGLSSWSLHYHCLSFVSELGIFQNLRGTKFFSPFEEEMRTRIFWTVYCMDRMLSTLKGRPVGLTDETCHLRLPLDIDDENLNEARLKPRLSNEPLTKISSAIHLFKLTKLASEIKMVLYCIERVYPPHTKPAITDYPQWRQDMVRRLKQWRDKIPKHADGHPASHLVTICEIKYHEVMMLTLRPNPLFRKPSHEAIRHCLESAVICIELYEKLYLSNSLQYSWTSVHSLFLCVMIIFYCVWTPGDNELSSLHFEIDKEMCRQKRLLKVLKAASNILSAIGDYWPEARRCRDVLSRMSSATLRRFTEKVVMLDGNRRESEIAGQPQLNIMNDSPATKVHPQQPQQNFSWMPWLPSTEIRDEDVAVSDTQYNTMSIENDLSELAEAGQLDTFLTADWLSYFENSNNWVNGGGFTDTLDGV